MKKTILFMSAVAMLAAVSCNKAEIDNSSTEVETPSVNNLVEFVAYTDVETKTSLNGLATEWEGGDMIDINGITFETSDVGSKATFTADEKPEVPYHAGYPCSLVYDNEEQVEGKLGFNFDNSFVLDAGTLCDDVLAVAYSESEPSLQFKNVVSLLKFRVPEFIEDITEIRISTTETLAGDIYVNYNDATWTIDEDRESFNEIVITPGSNKFEHGEDIYYYVPVLPGEKTNLTVRINGYIAATGKTIEFKRNFIHNLGTLPAPVASDYALIGSHSDWKFTSLITLYKEGNSYVAYNISGLDEFKIINKSATGWDGTLTTNRGGGETVKASGITYQKLFDNGSNIKVSSTSAKYNLTVSSDLSEITIEELNINAKPSNYSIIGSNNNWDSDIVLMTTSTENILVAKNIDFKKNVGVKIREGRDWTNNWSCDWKALKVNSTMDCRKGYDCNMLFADGSSNWDKSYDVYVKLASGAPSKFHIVTAGSTAPTF